MQDLYTPDISIIVPVYNAVDTLERAIDSVRDQTIDLRRVEVIIVDDASTDGSEHLVQKLDERYPFCRASNLREHVRGAGAPRNAGLDMARGTYVMFLDADDAYEPEACETLLDAITDSPDDTVSSEFRVIDDTHDYAHEIYSHPALRNAVNKAPVNIPEVFWLPPSIWARIYRRSFLSQNGIRFVKDLVNDDAIFSAHCLLSAKSATHIRESTYRYYRTVKSKHTSVTDTINEEYFHDFLVARTELISLYEELSTLSYHEVRGSLDARFLVRQILRGVLPPVTETLRAILSELGAILLAKPLPILNPFEQLIADMIAEGMFDELGTLLKAFRDQGGIT